MPPIFIASGKLRPLPAGRFAWLAVRVGAGYWPKRERPLPVGSWSCKVNEPGTGLPHEHNFGLAVIEVDKAGRKKIGDWFARGPVEGFPAFALNTLHGRVLAHNDRLHLVG